MIKSMRKMIRLKFFYMNVLFEKALFVVMSLL